MKKNLVAILVSLLAIVMFTGCEEIELPGSGTTTPPDNSVIVGYDAQGGSQPTLLCTTNVPGAAYGTLPVVSRTSYFFEGWWTATNEGGVLVTPETIVANPSNHVLYARWRVKEVTGISSSSPASIVKNVYDPNFKIAVTIEPADALDKNIIWTTGDATLVKVDSNGTITPLAEGSTWIKAEASNGINRIWNIRMKSYGIVAVSDRKIWYGRRTRAGFQWSSHTFTAGQRHWQGIAVSRDGKRIYGAEVGNVINGIAVESGYIYRSSDGGYTWQQCTGAGKRDWVDIACSEDGMHLVAADGYDAGRGNGNIFTSTDGGVTWNKCTAAGARDWRKVACSADGIHMAAVDDQDGPGEVHVSHDGGITWTKCPAGDRNWTAIAMSANGMTIAAADTNTKTLSPNDKGEILISKDGGSTWVKLTQLGDRDWNSIALSADGRILHATDGVQGANDYPDQITESEFFMYDLYTQSLCARWQNYREQTSKNVRCLGNNIAAYINHDSIAAFDHNYFCSYFGKPDSHSVSLIALFGDK